MSVLGIYFGSRLISIVETSGKKILNNIQIDRTAFSAGGLEEKVPGEIKIVTAVIEELKKNKVKAREANICLAGRDLIIRTFEMPMLSASELPNAVSFEVKKYIPFKVADLVSDFQALPDKASRKNLILFAGIKRETLDKYLIISEQLKIKTVSIEYSAFSMVRFLQLAGHKKKGIIGLLTVGFQEEEEINFTVLVNGFPLFSRDINLTVGLGDLAEPDKSQISEMLDKLKTEIRISLDYYHRKFPLKNIEEIFLLSAPEYRSELEGVMQEMDFPAHYLDVARFIDKTRGFNLSLIKGYSCALYKAVKSPLRINLLAAKVKAKPQPVTVPAEEAVPVERDWGALFSGLRIQPLVVLVSVLLCLGFFLLGLYQRLPIQKELDGVISLRPNVATVDASLRYEMLTEKDKEYQADIETFVGLVKQEFYNTQILEAIPVLMPREVWLTQLNFKKDEFKAKLLIRGTVYLNDSQKEIDLVHEFLANLRDSPVITKYFAKRDIVITAIEKGKIGALESTDFSIECEIAIDRTPRI
jgi:Tfp pilus assembly PilM family ATPase/Tfp pilus assembly protein PilN